MNVFNPDSSLSNMWKAFNNMPSKTTVLDRVTEREKSDQKAHVQKAISQATSKDYILSKQTTGDSLKRLEHAKAQQSSNTQETIDAFRKFLGKGQNVDSYV